jgi:hypothetical protein
MLNGLISFGTQWGPDMAAVNSLGVQKKTRKIMTI